MAVTKNRLPSAATREDLLQASKAIHDEVLESVDRKVKDVETGLFDYMVKQIGTRFKDEEHFQERLWNSFNVNLRKDFEGQLQSEVAKQVKMIREDHRADVELLKAMFSDFVEQIKAVVKAIPIPEITINPPEVRTPDIHNHVNVPEQSVTVQVPKQETPVVNILPSPPRTVTKSIAYAPDGRPVTITEKES